ncbi:Predicted Rossmann fold nucleotide-binding protein DprA/Smf involved in DNA uptake [Pseudomonas asplenii]|uniref:Predicted Rossmann fold nucleotide-binding protein DprA/Smf involved in DNA uptake n=1 Tax=Pseudomonas asplenii TaxID=53407 RepID=A0A1H1VWA4_9PSED|nr:DNA-processing protein DprA [Pseudomonas asplenii]SDS88710.1 Predicted Rossmann fold nucleotide-binding protein DprA/Smf involved in DNA uptake [Pseudomonas asplenii]
MINTNTQSILLLTSYFSKSVGNAKPLSPTEWGRFAQWLNAQGKTPADLVTAEPHAVLEGWHDEKIPLLRIEQLLERGHALALALEKWSRAGLWVLTRSDADYPKALKHHLRNSAPPILFGCGNPRLLNQRGIGVVGARKADNADLAYATSLGKRIAMAGMTVVSGGARGVDEAAMQGGLNEEGTVIGIMADSLLSAALASKWRNGLMNNNLVLVSPFFPEAGFNAGNAMARNKYIYCLSQAAVVVRSETKGGTWNGAIENLKKAWVPLWVKRDTKPESGNYALVVQGAQWLESAAEHVDVHTLSAQAKLGADPEMVPELAPTDQDASISEEESVRSDPPREEATHELSQDNGRSSQNVNSASTHAIAIGDLSFYQFFLRKMAFRDSPATAEELSEQWGISKKQLTEWLKQSVDERHVQKLKNPVRFQSLDVGKFEGSTGKNLDPSSDGQMGFKLD